MGKIMITFSSNDFSTPSESQIRELRVVENVDNSTE